jgi:hypothetical protein
LLKPNLTLPTLKQRKTPINAMEVKMTNLIHQQDKIRRFLKVTKIFLGLVLLALKILKLLSELLM